MKKFLTVAATLVVGILIGSLLVGSVFAAGPTPQTTPVPGSGYGRGGMMGGMRGGMVGDVGMEEEVLTLLNMTSEQVIAERQAGKSLVQIAQTKNVTEDQLVSAILAAKKAELDELVADGKLTQARADLMLENMEQAVTQAVNRTTAGPQWGNGAVNPNDCPMMDDDDSTQTPGAGRPTMPGRGGMRGGRGNGSTGSSI
jgi:hypothetical protein